MDRRKEQSNVWEKLVELIEESTGVVYGGEYGDEEICPQIDIFDEEIERIADHLISRGVTLQELNGCEYCNGLPFSQMEDFTMPNAYKKDYDIVTIRFCPMCGRRLPQPPQGE